MSKSIHKETWVNHKLLAYCEKFNKDCNLSDRITSSSDEMVTCVDCKELINFQTEITRQHTAIVTKK